MLLSVAIFRTGLLVKTLPLDYQSDWRCNNCDNVVTTEVVDAEVDRLEQMMNDVDMSDPDKLEELLWRLSDNTILHPRHYIILELSHSLIFAYKSSDAVSLTRPQMDRKIQLCHLVLSVSVFNIGNKHFIILITRCWEK